VTKLAINQLLSQQLFLQMYTTATLMHAAEMMLLADNGCCTTTFPFCMWWPHLTQWKSRLCYKILIKS